MDQTPQSIRDVNEERLRRLAPLANLRIVLVEPQFSGNLGSVARAMENVGITDLVLVNPKAKFDRASRSMAAKAQKTLHGARIVNQFEEALNDVSWAVAFTGCPKKRWKDHRAYEAVAPEIVSQCQSGEKIALVFGREDSGLDHATMDRCRFVTHLAVHPNYPSFNLAQAVLIAGYELLKISLGTLPLPVPKVPHRRGVLAADIREREGMYGDIENTLRAIGFIYSEDIAVVTMRKIRRILERGQLSKSETQFLRGVCRKLRWYEQRGVGGAPENIDTEPSTEERWLRDIKLGVLAKNER